jgi:Restriction alleviation protein Lar
MELPTTHTEWVMLSADDKQALNEQLTATLRPCPFCGSPAHIVRLHQVWAVHCRGDSCYVYGAPRELIGDAVAAWNGRA